MIMYLSGNPVYRIAEATIYTFDNDTTRSFDTQDIAQSQFSATDPVFKINQDEVVLFRGYPSSITLYSDNRYITNIRFDYDFQFEPVTYGDESLIATADEVK